MVLTKQPNWSRRGLFSVAVTIALLLATAISSCAFPEEVFDGSLDGDYYVNGFDHRGGEYSGVLTITTTVGSNVYDMQWIVTGSVQEGTGAVQGNRLVVEWNALQGFDALAHGDAVYEISPDGELRGERTVAGQEGTGTEEAFPLR